jgi:transcriptional regulator GlxA family with amidase domain
MFFAIFCDRILISPGDCLVAIALLRIERAKSLLHGSGLDVEAIAAEVGYSGGHTLRMLLRERLGRGVRELRADLF